MEILSLVKDALKGRFKFTYADSGEEVEKPEDLIAILKTFAELDLFVSRIINENETTRVV